MSGQYTARFVVCNVDESDRYLCRELMRQRGYFTHARTLRQVRGATPPTDGLD